MGYPMAGHLARAGHRVTVYNRTPAKAAAWVARVRRHERARRRARRRAAPTSSSPASATTTTCAPWCWATQGAFAGMKRRRDLRRPHHRVGRRRARALRRGRARGLQFVDAPVSGGQAGAQNGALTVMCGGDAGAFDAMKPVAMAFCAGRHAARRERRRPARQDGQPDRIAGLVQGLAEAIAFGQRAGLDMKRGARRHRQGRRAELADGQPRQDHDRRQVRLRLRGRLDAQGPRAWCSTRRDATARSCR